MKLSLPSFLAWLSILSGGALSVFCNTGWLNPSHIPALSQLQPQMGTIVRDHEIPVNPEVLGDLPPETFTFQSVIGPEAQEGRLYVAYYQRARRWTGRPHDLDVCYRAMGFEELQVETWHTPSGAAVWSRIFQRDDEVVRVVHWLQKPGLLPGPEKALQRLSRLFSAGGLRQDIASVYFEFPLNSSPSKPELLSAADTLIRNLESLWQ